MTTEKEQAAMDHFNQLAHGDIEWQKKVEQMKKAAETDAQRLKERLDGEVKASLLLDKLRGK